jgi:hypothetical protein
LAQQRPIVGPAFTREHRMLRFDGLAWTGCRRYSDELAEGLPAEHPVVFQLSIAALELGHVVVGDLVSGAPRRHWLWIKAREQIGPGRSGTH